MVRRVGFSLVEVIVAMVLLSIGLLGIAGTGLLAAHMMRAADTREAMLARATSVMDSLVAHDVLGAGRMPDARFRLEWTASHESVRVRAVLPDGDRFVLTALR